MKLVLKTLAVLHQDEAGQGLVEYLLILALVAFAATAGLHGIANSLNSVPSPRSAPSSVATLHRGVCEIAGRRSYAASNASQVHRPVPSDDARSGTNEAWNESETLKYLLIGAFVVAAVGAVKDVRGRTIPNWLTYSGLLMGLAVRASALGWAGLRAGLLGVLVGGGIFYLLFVVGGMGGGDVKLMAAVAAWAGKAETLRVLIAAAPSGGRNSSRGLYGASQENVANAAKHGHASEASPGFRSESSPVA